MNFPEDLKYSKEHEWVRIEGAVATMGITEFAQQELGEIVFAELPPIGKNYKQGESICVVESTKAASDVYAPISGSVKEVNQALADKPDLVNSSSYKDGWMVKFSNPNLAEAEGLMSAAQYKAFLGDKIS